MEKRKILIVAHNHPSVRPGGAENHALELYQAMRSSREQEVVFLARTGPPASPIRQYHEDAPMTAVDDDPNQYLFFTDASDYDPLFGRLRSKQVLTGSFRNFLLAQHPHIVHFHHTLFLGYDIIRLTRTAMPLTPIVWTLHEFMPICHREGQMVRTRSDDLCSMASPRRCHECFPDISPQSFFMRTRFIRSHLSLVDLFVAPSRFILERYVDWGIPRAKIELLANGRPAAPVADDAHGEPRNRFGYFGTLNHFKGIQVLLRAMEILGEDFDGHLWVHGASLEFQPESFRAQIEELLEATKEQVTFSGPYRREELAKLMSNIDWVVVPSIWWENAPLVIQEAFQHGRPVIASDIGGMAESVTDGVSGLHFRRADPRSLADVMTRAATTPGLWDTLKAGIPDVSRIDEQVAALARMYGTLLAQRDVAGADRSLFAIPHGDQ